MYFVYGCPKVLSLRPEPTPGEQIVAVSYNSSGSLLAIASTSRVCVWSGGKDHVPLAALSLELRGLSGTSLLWRARDSGLLAAVSAAGKLVLLSVKRKPGAKPASERFAVPDWFEPQHARLPMERDGLERDAWANPTEAELAVVSNVEAIGSDVSAMCQGRFGQHVLVGTANGAVYGVSWEGQILCCYDIVAVSNASPKGGIGDAGSMSTPDRTRFAGVGASSLSFNDTLQLLALTTTDGSFFLGTLSKNALWLRNIAVTERSSQAESPPPPPTTVSAAAAGAHSGNGRRGTPSARRHSSGGFDPLDRKDSPAESDGGSGGGSWGWNLWGTGRNAVAAAATAAAEALTAAATPPDVEATDTHGDRSSFPAGGRSPPAESSTAAPAPAGVGTDKSGMNASTGAVSVEFSAKGYLMAVALVDGTVLLTRVERYTSGVRARHKLQISDGMLHRSDSHRLAAFLADESAAERPGAWGSGTVPTEGGNADAKDTSTPQASTVPRDGSASSLWGVEVHHLHCLSLHPWLGPGDYRSGALGPAGKVLSMCFSSDGWALAVGHEGALTVWSTEDGTRLVCTTSDSRREDGGSSKSGAVDTSGDCVPVANGGNTSHHTSRYSGGGEIPPSETSGRDDDAGRAAGGAASGTLDLIAGGARALTWESEGYRLISVGGAVSGTAGSGSGAEAQGIVAFDFLRRARSNLSSALLSLQGSDRIALVDSQPWSAQMLLWRVLPVHPGYLASNAPLRHVSTSRAGTYVAVAGSRGLAVYSRPTNRWRLFGNVQQEQEVEVAGMCWWGESALVVASRLKHGFILLLFSRKHLNSDAVLLPPIKLPVGMRPLFMQAVQEGGSSPGTDVLFLLVAGSTSYLLYRFSCTGNVLESGNVTFSVLHEGALPHVLDNMEERNQRLNQVVEPSTERERGNTPVPSEQRDTERRELENGMVGGTVRATKDGDGSPPSTPPATTVVAETGAAGSRVAIIHGQTGARRSDMTLDGGRGGGKGRGIGSLPEIGPPKRVMLLPEVHPRSIALLDYDGNLVTMEMGNGEVKAVAEGVESVVDLSGVSEAWEVWEMPLLIHPCYLLRRKGKSVGGGNASGSGSDGSGSEEMPEEFSVWCPAMRLDPCPPSVQRLLTPGRGVGEGHDGRIPSPVFSLDPGASCDPERVDLGLQPLLGTMVHASQVVCYPRVSNIAPLPPCYEVRTHLRPILHMVLRHLLIASQLQLLDAPPPSPVPGSSSFSSKTYFARSVQLLDAPHGGNHADVRHGAPAVIPIVSSGRRIVPVETGFNGHARRNTEGGRKQDDVEEVSSSAAGEGGAEPDAVDASDQKRDWHGTSSDAFEIAIAVLKRCREDDVLVEALPDTLELLLRACMEGLHLAGERARRKAAAHHPWNGNGGISSAHSSSNGAGSATAEDAVSELELARAVMLDCVYLAQLVPACFHEVVARVARKAEPERYALLFPLHLIGDDGQADPQRSTLAVGKSPEGVSDGFKDVEGGAEGKEIAASDVRRRWRKRKGDRVVTAGPNWGRWAHPTHLFHECVSAGRFTTAAWYLPLVRDDVAYDAAQRHAGPDGPLSDEERERLMPKEMWVMAGREWSFGLSHALSCVLLLASLSSKQNTFLPEVWMFARKREQSAPHHHPDSRTSTSTAAATTKERASPAYQYSITSSSSWWERGQGAAVEAARVEAVASGKAVDNEGGGGGVHGRSNGHAGDGAGMRGGRGSILGRNQQHSQRMDRGLPPPASEAACSDYGEATHFGRTSRLRLRALQRPGRLDDADATMHEGGDEESGGDSSSSPVGSGEADRPERTESPPVLQQAERTRLYYLPFTRDVASVVSRFMWKELNGLRVKVVLKAFQSLASSPAAREAGLDPGQVLGALSPARRSMVGSLGSSPADTMAGLIVALAEMFKTSVGTLALVAAPPDANPVHEDKLSTAPADATSMDAHLRTGTMLTADDRPEHPDAGGRRVSKSSSSASGAGIVAVDAVPSTRSSWSEQDSGGDRGLPPQAPPLRARASLAALVRPQLELLADLSRAVGHGEAALTCASLLRDEGGVTATLSKSSQTLRVGYGHLISDLVGHLKKARTALETSTPTEMESPQVLLRAARSGDGPPPLPPPPAENEHIGGEGPLTPDRNSNGGPATVLAGSALDPRTSAIVGLQRFGGNCVRVVAEGAVLS